jgi:hypothetical protein
MVARIASGAIQLLVGPASTSRSSRAPLSLTLPFAYSSWACALFVLALRPTDAKGVPIACAVAFLFFVGLTVLLVCVAWVSTQWPQSGVAILVGLAIIALICLLIAALLWPTLNMRLPCCAKADEARLAELTELAKQNTAARKLTEAERVEMGFLQQKLAPMPPRRHGRQPY